MPLPDAEPTPNKANIYEQFSHIKVQDFTRDNLDVVRKPLNLNSQSEDVLRRIELVGKVTNQMSTSGPIPGSGIIVKVTSTSNATLTVLKPNPGEVWQLNAASATATGGAVRFKLGMITGDVPDITSDCVEIADVSPTSTSIQFSFVDLPGPLYVDSVTWMVINFSSMGVGEEGDCRVAFVRIR